MNIQPSIAVAVATTIVSCLTTPIFSQPSWAQTTFKSTDEVYPQSTVTPTEKRDGVSFYCGEIPDKETGEKIPATLAYVPQRRANIPIIAWKSKHLAAWNPQRRCEVVSPKFQTFYEDGRLNYLSNGENAGYPIICAVLDKQEQCSGENQLFQVRPGSNPEDVVLGLKEILEGKADGEIIYQSSDKQVYISVSELLEKAPAVDDETSTSN